LQSDAAKTSCRRFLPSDARSSCIGFSVVARPALGEVAYRTGTVLSPVNHRPQVTMAPLLADRSAQRANRSRPQERRKKASHYRLVPPPGADGPVREPLLVLHSAVRRPCIALRVTARAQLYRRTSTWVPPLQDLPRKSCSSRPSHTVRAPLDPSSFPPGERVNDTHQRRPQASCDVPEEADRAVLGSPSRRPL